MQISMQSIDDLWFSMIDVLRKNNDLARRIDNSPPASKPGNLDLFLSIGIRNYFGDRHDLKKFCDTVEERYGLPSEKVNAVMSEHLGKSCLYLAVNKEAEISSLSDIFRQELVALHKERHANPVETASSEIFLEPEHDYQSSERQMMFATGM